MEPDSDFDLLAASLRADATDLRAFLEALAAKLEGAFPDHVRVERSGLFGNKRVRRIEVDLGEHRYEIEQSGGALGTRRSRVVRGITLKNEDVDLDRWIDELARELVTAADRSDRGRRALERLLR